MVRTVSHQVSRKKRKDGSLPIEVSSPGDSVVASYSVDSDQSLDVSPRGFPIEILVSMNWRAGVNADQG